ncbi:putative DNA-DIRECTED RNA polymerase BETA SUBUNIT [Babesia divergens]|uniref:DNA-directed RNA polymerase subunit beta n=1 Tax=Babesia divergens TaxID=32595 RepID=A0AAD9G7U6_BABDI|nr:putative DNA-DIRECTED RNA polymerase BETA SUBUNIT [Babesia divergens]
MKDKRSVHFAESNETHHWDVSRDAAPVSDIKDKWRILPCYMGMRGIARQHINSYNNFVQREIKEIVNAPSNKMLKSDACKKFYIEFIDVKVGEPYMSENNNKPILLTPQLCRMRDITYSAPMYADVEYYNGEGVASKRVEIGRLPVMLRSCVCALTGGERQNGSVDNFELSSKLGECPYDPGGYFIIKGIEKVILMQEQLSKCRVIVETDVKKNICATVTSATAESKSRTAVVYKNQKLYVRHNSFTDDVPLCIILKAMGVATDQEIAQLIGTAGARDFLPKGGDYILMLQDLYNEGINSRMDALLFVGRKVRPRQMAKGFFMSSKERTPKTNQNLIEDTHDILTRVLLSHIPMRNCRDFSGKIKSLCLMARRVLSVASGKEPMDDKDHYGNKRLELAGQLISILFEDLFKAFLGQLKKQIDATLTRHYEIVSNCHSGEKIKYPDCLVSLPTDIITRGMQATISTGNWNIKRFRIERSGVSQILSRLSYISCLGMMTKTNSQFEKGRKVSKPRALQPSQFGLICPCDTPEGESCGLVKNLSLMNHVTTDGDIERLVELIYWLGVESADSLPARDLFDGEQNMTVFLNGIILGVHQNGRELIRNMIALRRRGKISAFVSVFENYQQRQVHISSDGGRLCRPLIVVEKGRPLLTSQMLKGLIDGEIALSKLFASGVLEWIDVNEENNSLIVMRESDITLKTTHLEISPMSMLGVVAGLIPFPNHNQSPRNTYQCAMGKQSIGTIGYNQLNRCDTILHLMTYPQRPLVTTKAIQLVNFDKLPAGQNVIVAVMSYQGYEIEDAVVINKASSERGFSRCYSLRRITVEIEKINHSTDRSGVNNMARLTDQLNVGEPVDKITGDNVIGVGQKVKKNETLLKKLSQLSTGEVTVSRIKYQFNQPAYVDRVMCITTIADTMLYKIMLRQVRLPEIGDKYSSRHGQKGVVGLIESQENLPFSEDGWVPDLIMNPHGFPSRMTVGKMLELVAAKAAVLNGIFEDGTPFEADSLPSIERSLIRKGFHPAGKEILYSGITGEPLETLIFTGPMYYQRLKHMVSDKIHARAVGPRQSLTRQPTEGRSKDGGLRLGEMERDCLIAYGASGLLVERLMLSSDVFQMEVCHKCGFIGYDGWCSYCKQRGQTASVSIPYACKLLFQELQAMNIRPNVILKEGMSGH